MTNNCEGRFFEVCRVKVAKELKIPPDNIDMKSIIDCCKRAIVEECGRSDQKGVIINPLTEEEKSAVFSEYGPTTISKIFNSEEPFCSWAEKFEENYVKIFLDNIDRKKEF